MLPQRTAAHPRSTASETSPQNAKVVVIGAGKEGLPLILGSE